MKTRIIVDAYGGDNAPEAVIEGAIMALEAFGDEIEIILVGKENEIRASAGSFGAEEKFSYLHADGIITNDDAPNSILKQNKNSSMAVGLEYLKAGGGDAFVSAGSTGALLFGGTFIIKRIKGVKRPALAAVMPSGKGPFMLLDCGANVECRVEYLAQFAQLGSTYMETVMGIKEPRVALLNNGTEEHKGTALQIEANPLLENCGVNYIGNLEAREAVEGGCDVIVADGFSGNVMLKSMEGLGAVIISMIKEMFSSSVIGKVSAALIMGKLKDFKHAMDYTEYGGAPLLGLSKPVIKAHGSSNAKAFASAIRQAKLFYEGNAIKKVSEKLAASKEDLSDGEEES